uniref:Uncharacterized protein n=1 Tax=Anguilla anguilla TaxID=7936 RepID=A0A0E9U314_ANGAN
MSKYISRRTRTRNTGLGEHWNKRRQSQRLRPYPNLYMTGILNSRQVH